MSRSTWDTSRFLQDFVYGAFTLCGRPFHAVLLSIQIPYRGPATPLCKQSGLGCSAFARRYLRNHYLFSLPQGTEMFHFPWCRSIALCIQATVSEHYPGKVAPFGNLRIKACLPLPEAYRSLPRPSSPTDAKASIVRPYALDQVKFLAFSTKVVLPFPM